MSHRSSLIVRLGAACASTALIGGLAAACTSAEPAPTAAPGTPVTSSPPSLDSHESGPASPIAFGVRVPDGAVQLGPLVRIRSQKLLDEFGPDLEAALGEEIAEEDEPTEDIVEPDETVPTQTPATPPVPTSDSFDALEDPPRPDVTTSLMRITGPPTEVLQRMLAEIAALLPDRSIVVDNLAVYCESVHRRITGCELNESGTTAEGHPVAVHLTVDPGNVTTRTANAGSRDQPVMVLTMSYAGDPREGQADRSVPALDISSDLPEDTSGLIWPKMDESAPDDESLIGEWLESEEATLLLSGDRPVNFSIAAAPKSSRAVTIASQFLAKYAPKATVSTDDIVQLNESTIVRRAERANGSTLLTITTVSARGNYVSVYVLPPTRSNP